MNSEHSGDEAGSSGIGTASLPHTPGPWLYRSQELDDWGIVRAGRYIICQARNPDSTRELEAQARRKGFDPFEANARLIAAAPDLLEVTQLLAGFAEKASTLDWNEDRNVTWATIVAAKARAAIAKAALSTPSQEHRE